MDHRSILMSVLAIGVTAAMLGVGTMAYFSDTEESTGNILKAGTLDIELLPEGSSSAIWTFTDLKPGDVIYPAFVVNNAGSLTVSDIIQKLYITEDAGELDGYLGVLGFWVGVVDTMDDAESVIADPTTMPGPDPGFNDYKGMGTFKWNDALQKFEGRYIMELVDKSQTLDIDITSDGNVPDRELPSGKFLVYIYEMEFEETGGDQNDAQGDRLVLKITLEAKQ